MAAATTWFIFWSGRPRTGRNCAGSATPRISARGRRSAAAYLAARGNLLLVADADGATPIEEEKALAAAIQAGADVAVGSRLLASSDRRRVRRRFRGLAGRLFSATARRLLRLSVRDTQCGFKMFRGEAGRHIFALVHEQRFLFDLEALVLANRLGLETVEVPISWHEIPGGHFHLVRELPSIALGLWQLRRRLLKTPLSRRERDRG